MEKVKKTIFEQNGDNKEKTRKRIVGLKNIIT